MSTDMERLLKAIREQGAILPEDGVSELTLPSVEPKYADRNVLKRLHFELRSALIELGISDLYEHQARAIELALDGNNVVLQSPTASGKTLAFQLPMLDALIRDPDSRAMMIYPTKALAKDQEEQLTNITRLLPSAEITVEAYDGDTPKDKRPEIKGNPPRILRTNPDMLHFSFLAWAEQWEQVFSTLRWIIVDEIHEYRGYFGSNVSLVLRRLSHHLGVHYGVTPQFFLSSATCANAAEHANQLTGLKFDEVGEDADLRPSRHYWAVQLDLPDAGYWEQLKERVVDAAIGCLLAGQRVLIFCPTRIFAEDCKRAADIHLEDLRAQARTKEDDGVVQVYRGGLSAGQRAKIQEAMQSGDVKVVFATNALEIGINVGGLDGVILAGFPNNMMSARQQIGRAGRNWKNDAFVVYFPRNNPLDRYYAGNVREFIDRPLDDLVINPKNNVLVERHLRCVLFETGTVENGKALLGEALYEEGVKKEDKYVGRSIRSSRPHYSVDIRGIGGNSYELKLGRTTIGTMSDYQQFREASEDAIYFHGGDAYRVISVTTKRNGPGEVELDEVEESERYLRTNPKVSATLSNEEPNQGYRWKSDDVTVDVFYGQVTVTERIHLIEEIDERTNARRRAWQPNRASFYWDAEAFWVKFERNVGAKPDDVLALEQMLRIGTLFAILADEHDIVTQATGAGGSAYIVESYEGGIGIATQLLTRWKEVLKKGMEIAEECPCVQGCPNCIVPPRMRDQPNKQGGLVLAYEILMATEPGHGEEFRNDFWEPVVSRKRP